MNRAPWNLAVAAAAACASLATVQQAPAAPASAVEAAARPAAASTPGRPIRWLAVGDSYSAGEGLPDVSEPTCQRADGQNGHASKAWAVFARDELGIALPIAPDTGGRKGFDFEACTGAVSEDLFTNWNNKQEWDPNNNGRFDLVTFSFGGNNIGFETILPNCIGASWAGAAAATSGGIVSGPLGAVSSWLNLAGCPSESDMRKSIDGLKTGGNDQHGHHLDPLSSFYHHVAKDVVTPGGNVVVVGYPELIEDPQFWPVFNQTIGVCQGIRRRDALLLRSMAAYLNQTIGEAVKEANNNSAGVHFTFVDVNSGQPDSGVAYSDRRLFEPSSGDRHNLCAAKPWLNGITTGVSGGDFRKERSFHPTQNGQTQEGLLVAQRIQQLDWTGLGSSETTASTVEPTTVEPAVNPIACQSGNLTVAVPANIVARFTDNPVSIDNVVCADRWILVAYRPPGIDGVRIGVISLDTGNGILLFGYGSNARCITQFVSDATAAATLSEGFTDQGPCASSSDSSTAALVSLPAPTEQTCTSIDVGVLDGYLTTAFPNAANFDQLSVVTVLGLDVGAQSVDFEVDNVIDQNNNTGYTVLVRGGTIRTALNYDLRVGAAHLQGIQPIIDLYSNSKTTPSTLVLNTIRDLPSSPWAVKACNFLPGGTVAPGE